MLLGLPMGQGWDEFPRGRGNDFRPNRQARVGERDRRIAGRYFEQGPAPRQWISDQPPAPALSHIGAFVALTIVIVVAGAAALLRV